MADKKKLLYQAISNEMQAMKEEILQEVKNDALFAQIEVHTQRILTAVENAVDYQRIVDETAKKVATMISTPEVDYDRLATVIADKLTAKERVIDFVLDEEGLNAIADSVTQKLGCVCQGGNAALPTSIEGGAPSCQSSTADELCATFDLSAADEQPVLPFAQGEEIRLKRSFTAKLKQSEEKVKEYYSALKNELVSYKKINSNISWNGDRFNFGRETVAKINICGKTLGLYLALDPANEEFKQTVYHQKDVSAQKAYESTPFMVKIKSDAAVKKALRLISALAEKLSTKKEEGFQTSDYVAQFTYATTKQLYEEGFIKATKEKKVDLDF